MKKLLKVLLAATIALSLSALNSCSTAKAVADSGNTAGDKADMSSYTTYDESEDYVFVKSDIKDMKRRADNKETFVIYFGFSRCPWCRDLMPVLNQAARKTGNKTVYYADTRANKDWKSNIDMDDYELLVDMAFDYLPYDENNIKHLDAPTVYFVKNGKIQEAVFAPEYDAPKETIPDDLREKLMADLTRAFKALR